MSVAASTWAVYARTLGGFVRITTVHGTHEGNAMDAACRLFDGPCNPIVAHAYSGQGEPVDFSLIPAPRRSRRHP